MYAHYGLSAPFLHRESTDSDYIALGRAIELRTHWLHIQTNSDM